MASQMQNKVCVITGGAGSIGAASAKLLRDEGAKLMLIDLHQAALQKPPATSVMRSHGAPPT
jgi:NADP-dependent 3-hydroxy acid dehydrogenase YdfG